MSYVCPGRQYASWKPMYDRRYDGGGGLVPEPVPGNHCHDDQRNPRPTFEGAPVTKDLCVGSLVEATTAAVVTGIVVMPSVVILVAARWATPVIGALKPIAAVALYPARICGLALWTVPPAHASPLRRSSKNTSGSHSHLKASYGQQLGLARKCVNCSCSQL